MQVKGNVKNSAFSFFEILVFFLLLFSPQKSRQLSEHSGYDSFTSSRRKSLPHPTLKGVFLPFLQ